MLKSIALGVLTVVVGPWIGFVLSLLVGLIIDPLVTRNVASSGNSDLFYSFILR
jgi:hypothetical protein